MRTPATSRQRPPRRGAILSMELVLVLPIFLLLIFSIVEFSLLMSARTRVSDAARQGVRLLSLSSCSADEVRETVISVLGSSLGRQCRVDVRPGAAVGDTAHVHVSVPMQNASPDLLWPTGFSVTGRWLEADAYLLMERACPSQPTQRL